MARICEGKEQFRYRAKPGPQLVECPLAIVRCLLDLAKPPTDPLTHLTDFCFISIDREKSDQWGQ